jgi:hypothetical protein
LRPKGEAGEFRNVSIFLKIFKFEQVFDVFVPP